MRFLAWIRNCFTCCSRAGAWKSVPFFCQDCNWFNLKLPPVLSLHRLPGVEWLDVNCCVSLFVWWRERSKLKGCAIQTNVSWSLLFLCGSFALIAANVDFLPISVPILVFTSGSTSLANSCWQILWQADSVGLLEAFLLFTAHNVHQTSGVCRSHFTFPAAKKHCLGLE